MMEEKQAGITALVTAYARAYHAAHDAPLIFYDFLAGQLFSAEEKVFFAGSLAGLLELVAPELAAQHPAREAALAAVMQRYSAPITLSRSRYTEDCLEQAIRQGMDQYVILGAGLDTFAFRRSDLAPRLQVFEVDHPATQERKRQRVAAAGWDLPAHLRLAAVNFGCEDLVAALLAAGFNLRKPAFFSWLGVSYYLSRRAAETTLREIAGLAAPGSRLVLDYLDADALIPGKAARAVQVMQSIVRQTGEPMKTGFAPAALGGTLGGLGFQLEENLSPADIEARYFQGRADSYHAVEQVHFACARMGDWPVNEAENRTKNSI